jgi:hypothetical protein
MERLTTPLLPALWRDVARAAAPVAHRISYQAQYWWQEAREQRSPLAALAGAAALRSCCRP